MLTFEELLHSKVLRNTNKLPMISRLPETSNPTILNLSSIKNKSMKLNTRNYVIQVRKRIDELDDLGYLLFYQYIDILLLLINHIKMNNIA